MEEQAATVINRIKRFTKFDQGSRMIMILLFMVYCSFSASAQKKSDIGFFAGTSYYMGDLNPSRHFYSPGFAVGPFYRYNFEPRNSIRLNAVYHNLSGYSAGFGDPYVESLNASFAASFIDASANYEINFIPYKTTDKKLNQSLYLTAGLGYHLVLSSDVPAANNHMILPFGIGYKVNLAKKLSAGAEFTVRKTFNDTAIDGVTNFSSESTGSLFGNKDWFTFAGIFISYKIFNFREDCPAYD